MNRYLLTRKNRLRTRQYFMLFTIFLVFISGILPSFELMTINAESDAIVEPIVSKDIEGENEKEIIPGEDYNYNVKVSLPENISGYESMTITDDLDKRLTIQDTSVLVNDEENNELQVEVNKQSVSLNLLNEQLDELVGKEITLQITTQIKEDVATDEEITNIAEVVINEDIILETDEAIVTIIDSDTSENKDTNELADKSKENTKEDDKSLNKKAKEETSELEEKEEKTVTKSKSEKESSIQVQSNDGITMNDTDFYDYAAGWIIQYEGDPEEIKKNNGETWEKGRVKSSLNGGNGFAKYGDTFYVYTGENGEDELYSIDVSGNVNKLDNLWASTATGGMSNDGSKYVYVYRWTDGDIWISSYDVNTRQTEDHKINNVTDNSNINHNASGDLVVDGEGYVWHAYYTSESSFIVRINPKTGELDRVIPVKYKDGTPLQSLGELAFLSDGTMAGLEGHQLPYDLVMIDPRTGYVEGIIGTTNDRSADFASSAFPTLQPELSVVKSVNPNEEVHLGEELTYTLEVENSGNVASTGTIVKDDLPEGVSYITESTTLNGEEVSDIDGQSPLFEGMTVNSPDTENGVVFVGEENNATVTFKVKIDDGAEVGDEIVNIASVSSAEIEEFESNEVKNKIVYKDPVLDSTKSAELEEKADGNTDADNPEVGDTIRYTITTQNTIADSLVENLVITDEVPEGVTYVDESLEVDGESVTDAEDDDAGHVVDGQVTGTFGDVTDTDTHTVTFLVTVDKGQAGKDIQNIALVDSDSPGDPDEPEEEVKIYPREPVLEGEKSAENKEEDKDKFEVGDTVIYTIQGRNSVSDSLVEDFVISDELPEGLEFVEDSLIVSHDGEATFTDGVITATFGDVEDTEWRSVTFEVIIASGQADETIENMATVEGEEVPPTTPEEEIVVEYTDPELESTKAATLETKADGNTDADNPEVGDTIRYTITTQNTVEDSIVENLVITDDIPEGVTYVAESLEVDGESVTDAEDDDAGHVVDGQVTGTFGDVTDTDEHTVTFLVTVDKGQAGKDIQNIALVDSDSPGDPDEPEEEVKVYPREPVLEGEKSAENKEEGKDEFEVGDTVIYTIQGRNTVSDSLVEDFVISDELPEGLEFVEDSLIVSHDGEATFTDGVITAMFGDVEDTEWRTVTFEATIQSGQADETIENIATVEGEDGKGEEVPPVNPEEEIVVEYKDPKLESSKSATIESKADGNTDADNPEVGDTIRYTITTKNSIEDSLVENLVITDEIPEGVTYVDESLEVDGESVTDAEDDDAGHVVDGEVTGNFGDITDTEDYTVTFLVTVDEGQAGTDINNIAVVDGDNIDDPDEPEEELIVYPREPILEGEKSAENKEEGKEEFEVGDTVVYTIEGRNTVSDSLVEDFVISDELPEGLEFVEDSLIVSHDGEATFTDGVITAMFGDVEDTEWRTVTFEATIQSGQADETIENIASVEGEDSKGEEVPPVNPEEEIVVEYKDPKLESSKSATIESKADGNTDADNPEVGDTIRYTITTKNTIEDSLVENLVITDEIPEGVTYVDESLEVDGESVTDAEDDDAGHVVDGEVTGNFGDITDTEDYTVTFLVTVDEGQAGTDINNIAVVDGDNIDDPDEPEEELIVYPREPILEGEKSAENKEEGKEEFEVGDTVVYTIEGRNTVSDSLVEDFVITDELPEGLEFVEGSLEASHDGEATFTDGVITAMFGDVEDTELRTVTFETIIVADQSGNTIKNIATVGGKNIDQPEKPEEEIVIDVIDPVKPKDPVEPSEPEQPNEGNKLPKTATSIFNLIIVGIGLMATGLLVRFLKRRRTA